ncbi:MAG: metallophosphatase family protein [Proteobacteria bacterium]|nr:metallophosphatase family protein [Pseudomonadota bacterium]
MSNRVITIGVVSDTHLDRDDGSFLKLIERFFRDCHLIIHCGDITNEDIFLSVKRDIVAVRGNMDLNSNLPIKKELNILNKKIGIIHGYGSPTGIRERIRKVFDEVDCILYGHTHNPFCDYEKGVLFFNPGSAFDKRWAPKRTIGYLIVTEDKIDGKIVEID